MSIARLVQLTMQHLQLRSLQRHLKRSSVALLCAAAGKCPMCAHVLKARVSHAARLQRGVKENGKEDRPAECSAT